MTEKVRFWIARLINDHTDWCWTELVMWALGYEGYSLLGCRHSEECIAHREARTCYCGKFTDNPSSIAKVEAVDNYRERKKKREPASRPVPSTEDTPTKEV